MGHLADMCRDVQRIDEKSLTFTGRLSSRISRFAYPGTGFLPDGDMQVPVIRRSTHKGIVEIQARTARRPKDCRSKKAVGSR